LTRSIDLLVTMLLQDSLTTSKSSQQDVKSKSLHDNYSPPVGRVKKCS